MGQHRRAQGMACHAGARGLGASAELPLNADILSPQLAALAIAVLQYCLCAGDTVPVDPPPPPTRLTRPSRALSSPHTARDSAPLSSGQPVCSSPAASAPTTPACTALHLRLQPRAPTAPPTRPRAAARLAAASLRLRPSSPCPSHPQRRVHGPCAVCLRAVASSPSSPPTCALRRPPPIPSFDLELSVLPFEKQNPSASAKMQPPSR